MIIKKYNIKFMFIELISVGLFWSILVYYTRESGQHLNIASLAKSIIPDKKFINRKLKRYKIYRKIVTNISNIDEIM